MKSVFGQKVYKLAIDGGFTCPNRDDTWDRAAVFSAAQAVQEILQPHEPNALPIRSKKGRLC